MTLRRSRRKSRVAPIAAQNEGNGLDLKKGCVVWGKYGNHPWWPVELLEDFNKKSGKGLVAFLGDDCDGEIRGKRNFECFESCYLKHFKGQSASQSYWTEKRKKQFISGVDEARKRFAKNKGISSADFDFNQTKHASAEQIKALSTKLTPGIIGSEERKRRVSKRTASKKQASKSSRKKITPNDQAKQEQLIEEKEEEEATGDDVEEVQEELIEVPFWSRFSPMVLMTGKELQLNPSTENLSTCRMMGYTITSQCERLMFSTCGEHAIERCCLMAVRLLRCSVTRDATMVNRTIIDSLVSDYFLGDYEVALEEGDQQNSELDPMDDEQDDSESGSPSDATQSVFSPAFLAAHDQVRNELFQVLRHNQNRFAPLYYSRLWKPTSWTTIEQALAVVIDALQRFHVKIVLEKSRDPVGVARAHGNVQLRLQALRFISTELQRDLRNKRSDAMSLIGMLFSNAQAKGSFNDGAHKALVRISEYGALFLKNLKAVSTSEFSTQLKIRNTLTSLNHTFKEFLSTMWKGLKPHLPTNLTTQYEGVLRTGDSLASMMSGKFAPQASCMEGNLEPHIRMLDSIVNNVKDDDEGFDLGPQLDTIEKSTGSFLALGSIISRECWATFSAVAPQISDYEPSVEERTKQASTGCGSESNNAASDVVVEVAPVTKEKKHTTQSRSKSSVSGKQELAIPVDENIKVSEPITLAQQKPRDPVTTTAKRDSATSNTVTIEEQTKQNGNSRPTTLPKRQPLAEIAPTDNQAPKVTKKISALKTVAMEVEDEVVELKSLIEKKVSALNRQPTVPTSPAPHGETGGSPRKRSTPFSVNNRAVKKAKTPSPVKRVASSHSSSQMESPLKGGVSEPYCLRQNIPPGTKEVLTINLTSKQRKRAAKPIRIGRARDCTFQLVSKNEDALLGVSRHHATVEVKFGTNGRHAHVLSDCFSVNGTFINWIRMPPGSKRVLKPGDCVTFGGGNSVKPNEYKHFTTEFSFQYVPRK